MKQLLPAVLKPSSFFKRAANPVLRSNRKTFLAPLLLTACLVMLAGCSESKEGRIRALEAEIKQARTELHELKDKVNAIEKANTADEQSQ